MKAPFSVMAFSTQKQRIICEWLWLCVMLMILNEEEWTLCVIGLFNSDYIIIRDENV